MAQTIDLLNAVYGAVPAVLLPKQGGGTARFDDCSVVTAAASDVAQGKIFVASDGTITTGTATGGASNFITGTFTTGAKNQLSTLNLPYTGSGYAICGIFFPEGGVYSGTWYSGVLRYAVGIFAFTKSLTSTTPTYETTGNDNAAAIVAVYKDSSSSSSTYNRTSVMGANLYTTSDALSSGGQSVIKFKNNNKTMTYRTGNGTSSTYGLYPNIEYRYCIMYSS